jgi:hypothetical protein
MEISIVRKVANSPEYFTEGVEKWRMACPYQKLHPLAACPLYILEKVAHEWRSVFKEKYRLSAMT